MANSVPEARPAARSARGVDNRPSHAAIKNLPALLNVTTLTAGSARAVATAASNAVDLYVDHVQSVQLLKLEGCNTVGDRKGYRKMSLAILRA